jgi:uncharacterized protein (TIGR02594 family)
MKYIIVLLSALGLSACAPTMSSNDRFYEEVYKPRYRTLVMQQEDPKEKTQEVAEQEAEKPEPKPEVVIRVHRMNPVYQSIKFLDYTEKENRSELKELTGVDPVRVEWCAAFANAILEQSELPSNKDHKYALTARAFLDWGKKVDKPEMGDIVVFPRGNQGWQGHVGFYVKEQMIDGVLYYYILGGNQKNSVRVDLYRADKALGIRRAID